MDIRSPFIILLEMLGGLIENFVSSFQLIFNKMLELFVSLSIISGLGPLGFVASATIGSVIFFLVIKLVFGTSKELFYISLFYFLLFILFSISLVST